MLSRVRGSKLWIDGSGLTPLGSAAISANVGLGVQLPLINKNKDPMKKTTLLLTIGLVLFFSAWSFESYTRQNKMAKAGQKAQIKHAKPNICKHGMILSIL
jgi:hypothetical protein